MCHNDLRAPNMLWNAERGRVKIIDFEDAEFVPAPKNERLLILSNADKDFKKRARVRNAVRQKYVCG